MKKSRLAETFDRLKAENRQGFIPFITAGDPDLPTTGDLILMLARNGASVIELGVPFSDPMADGVVIQRASERALKNDFGIAEILEAEKDLSGAKTHFEEAFRLNPSDVVSKQHLERLSVP